SFCRKSIAHAGKPKVFRATLQYVASAAPRAYGRPRSRQFLQQRLRILQIARVEPLPKPPVNRSQQFARLLQLALVAPEAREAHGGAKLQKLRLLRACNRKRLAESGFSRLSVVVRASK